MPEKKVQRIEKIQFANMGYKAVGIYARVSTCLPSQLHSRYCQELCAKMFAGSG